jgi:S1-C subfamily serine protease
MTDTPEPEEPTVEQPASTGAPKPAGAGPSDAGHWWRTEDDPRVWAPPGPSRLADDGSPSETGAAPVAAPQHRGWNPWLIVGACLLAFVVAFAGVGIVRYASDQRSARPTLSQVTPSTLVPGPTPTTEAPGSSGGTSPDQSSGSASTDTLTAGIVNINTNSSFGGAGAGTGMVLTSSGAVLTNNHVVSGASNIRVEVPSTGNTYAATVVGTDATDDVAVIQLKGASGLATITTGNSANVRVGDAVTAVGNALGRGGTPTVATGSVQALNQSITVGDPATGVEESLTGLIRTDARLQPGDSGGALADQASRVIGMNTAASVSGRFRVGPAEGYAIPINQALDIAAKIQAGQSSATIQIGPPAFLGVAIVAPAQAGTALNGYTPPSPNGAVVASAQPGTPAANAGLGSGDEITAIDGRSVDSPATLKTILKGHKPGDRVRVRWLDSSGRQHDASVQLAAGPAA